MDYIQPHNRHQVTFGSIEEQIEQDNAVRFVELFVEQLELNMLGYEVQPLQPEGRPPFHPKVFLK